MKKIKIQNIFFAIMAIVMITFATSCEKIGENKEVVNNDNNDKAFYNVKWAPVMQKSDMINEDGLKGDLYVNENNMQDLMFLIDVNENLDNPLINDPNDPCYANDPLCEQATGTYIEVNDIANNIIAIKCEKPAKDCWWTTEYYDGKWQKILNNCPKPAVRE